MSTDPRFGLENTAKVAGHCFGNFAYIFNTGKLLAMRHSDFPADVFENVQTNATKAFSHLIRLLAEAKGWDVELFLEEFIAAQFDYIRKMYPPALAERIIEEAMQARRAELLREGRAPR